MRVFALKWRGRLLRMLSSSLEGSFEAQRAVGRRSRALSPLLWPLGSMLSLPESHNRELHMQEKTPKESGLWSRGAGQWHPPLGRSLPVHGGDGGICCLGGSAARPTPGGSFGGGCSSGFILQVAATGGTCCAGGTASREVQGTCPRGVTSSSPPQPCCWLSLYRAEHPQG